MQNLQEIETEALLDVLAQQTACYTAKISEKNSVEIQQYEYDIAMIQAELNFRNPKSNTKITNQDS